MKRFNTFLMAFSLVGVLSASAGLATFSGSGPGVGYLESIFARLGVQNTFDEDQIIDKSGTSTADERRGINTTHNQVASYCLSNSDSATKDYCLSSRNSLIVLEGSTGSDLYGTASASNTFLVGDSIQSRLWLAPNGVSMFSTANNTPPSPAMPSGIMVGSNAQNAATFLVDATNDWTKHLPIAAPAASECDAADEKGRMYFDSTANAFKYCNGTAWSDFGGGGGGVETDLSIIANQIDVSFYNDGNVEFRYDVSVPGLDMYMRTEPANFGGIGQGDIRANCARDDGTTEAKFITTVDSKYDFSTATMPSGSRIECTFMAENDPDYPVYYVTGFNGGTQAVNRRASWKVEKVTP